MTSFELVNSFGGAVALLAAPLFIDVPCITVEARPICCHPQRSATRPQNGESECPLQDHDDLFSLSQHWRSASRLALPPLLRPGQCTRLVSPWCGHTRKSMRRIACLRRAPLGRNRRAMLMIRSLPSGWDNNGRQLQWRQSRSVRSPTVPTFRPRHRCRPPLAIEIHSRRAFLRTVRLTPARPSCDTSRGVSGF